MARRRRYNPTQPRDHRGRWVATGVRAAGRAAAGATAGYLAARHPLAAASGAVISRSVTRARRRPPQPKRRIILPPPDSGQTVNLHITLAPRTTGTRIRR